MKALLLSLCLAQSTAADLGTAFADLRRADGDAAIARRITVMPPDESLAPAELVALTGDPQSAVRHAATQVALRHARSRPAIRAAVAAGLGDPAPTVRAACAEILGRLGDGDAPEQAALVAILDDAHVAVRLRAAWALAGRHADPRIRVTLGEALVADPASVLAIDGLGRGYGGEPAARAAIRVAAAAGSATEASLGAVARVLGATLRDDAQFVATIAVLATHPSHVVRRNAISAFAGMVDDPRGRAALAAALADAHPDVRTAAADGLSGMAVPAELPIDALTAALADPVPSVRSAAAAALAPCAQRSAVREALTRLRDADPDPTVRLIATRALEVP